jgi:hypothetical protein
MAHVIELRPTVGQQPSKALTLAEALERLASAGYEADAHTWEQFVDAGLLRHSKTASAKLTEVSTQDFKRFRQLLDVRLRVGNRASFDELCFYACAANVSDVPTPRVVSYVESGIASFFAAATDALHTANGLPDRLGIEGQRVLSFRLATSLLGSQPTRARQPSNNIEWLMTTCCTLFLHATWRNRTRGRGPAPRILTPAVLEAEETPISAMTAGRPLRSRAAEITLPPIADLEKIIDGLRRAAYDRSADVASAAAGAVRLVDGQFASADHSKLPIIVKSVAPLLTAAFIRVRTSAPNGTAERLVASAWTDQRAFQSALLAYWT